MGPVGGRTVRHKGHVREEDSQVDKHVTWKEWAHSVVTKGSRTSDVGEGSRRGGEWLGKWSTQHRVKQPRERRG